MATIPQPRGRSPSTRSRSRAAPSTTQGSGPPLVLIGGGASNADTLGALATRLATDRTVITYDRRGYSRSHLDDPSRPASIPIHAGDVRLVLEDLGAGAPTVFATSVGALIGLELLASHPAALAAALAPLLP